MTASQQIVVRSATATDIPALVDRQDRLIGEPVRWDDRVSDGVTRCLIAEDGGEQLGHLVAGPRFDDQVYAEAPRGADRGVWWKLFAIAVEPTSRRQGIGTTLLGELLEQLPREVVGLWGNVDDDRAAAIAWYREKGFYLAPTIALVDRPTRLAGAFGVVLRPVPGSTGPYFRSWVHSLRRHVRTPPTIEEQTKLVTAETDRLVATRERGHDPFLTRGRDVGYRTFAHEFVGRGGPVCQHVDKYGPRPLVGFGWDPERHLVCEECRFDRAQAIKPFDREDRCDGCGALSPRDLPRIGMGRVDNVLVSAALCDRCRAR